MNILSITKADQYIPISKARSVLSSLIDNIGDKNFLVFVKKYEPKAALVDLSFFEKLLEVYQRWTREQDFTALEKIKKSAPSYLEKEVEEDISNALKKIRAAR